MNDYETTSSHTEPCMEISALQFVHCKTLTPLRFPYSTLKHAFCSIGDVAL